jgi:hypothetical protein
VQRLGGCEKFDAEEGIVEAVALANKSDVVVFVGGLTPEWESEGFDRPTLDMPGLQNQTISRLADANPNTIVVIQAVGMFFFLSAVDIDVFKGIGCVDAMDRLRVGNCASLVFWQRSGERSFRCTLWESQPERAFTTDFACLQSR